MTVAAAAAATTNAVAGTVADKVPSATPTDMSHWIPAFAGMTSHSNFVATDNNRAAVAGTVATTDATVGNGAVATRDAYMRPLRKSNAVGTVGDDRVVAVGDGHVRPVFANALRPDDATIATNATTHKSSFPRTRESRTNNSAQPSEFAAVTGASRPDDATIVASGAASKIVIPAGRRNPDAGTATSSVALPWTASIAGDTVESPAAGDVANGTVGATHLTAADTTAPAGNRRHTAAAAATTALN